MKYKRLRKIRQIIYLLDLQYHKKVTYYQIKKLFEEGMVGGYRDGKTIYIFYDDVIKKILR